ncbi:hypothetical protein FVR03_22915 [Pontibacter qinzhouensis]|uniref:Uncharacterized protein n=1 Tax=Pontibacter qinzhouensis TaxID=2603253 RepID=A0A5C8INJ7_9BACT|nr:hypothetical protein FVR03_22915 [Pontibacter qinzhouensis]
MKTEMVYHYQFTTR